VRRGKAFHRVRIGIVVALVAAMAPIAPSRASAAPATAAVATRDATPPVDPWTEADGNPQLTGVNPSTRLSAANAGRLGVKWMANLTAAALDSPVAAYNQELAETLVYSGSENGSFSAFDLGSGRTVWSVNLGSAVRMTPAIDGGYIWVADTYSPLLYKLDAATGAVLCSAPIYAVAEASPIVVTPPGGRPTVFMGSNDLGESGPLYSVNEADCSINWSFSAYGSPPGSATSGLWDFISYGVDAASEPLVLFGTADPDAAVYALDANTGVEVWRFQTFNPDEGPADIGAGVTVAQPGTPAGGADGAAFVASKDGIMYALDLTTGQQLWAYTFQSPVIANGSRSTAALAGLNLVFGTSTGVFDLNPLTGAPIWHYVLPNGDEDLGAVSVTGPVGRQIVLTTNVDGQFQVLSLATGALLYSYQTSNYLASSAAVVDGNVLLNAADGFLYEFGLQGGNGGAPTTAVTSPSESAVIANPTKGWVTITGTAADASGVKGVTVAVQAGGAQGRWWDAAGGSWVSGTTDNNATLASKGAPSTTWTLRVPVSAAGTIMEVWASATNRSNTADQSADSSRESDARISFTVSPSTSAPTLEMSAPRAAPGSQVTVSGGGYQPGEVVDVAMTTTPVTALASVTALADGTLPATAVTIPVLTVFGPISVTATGESSGKQSSAAVTLANDWAQYGQNAAKTSFELNDKALNNNVAAAGRFYLDLAYNVPAASPIRSTVAIDKGRAFFGDDAGDLIAVDVNSGAVRWQDAEAGAIDASAAVDAGMVIVGTQAGSVVAVNEVTGAPIWSTPTGGAVESSPAVYNGVVYVGADDGDLYALDEASGTVLWATALHGPVHSSPSVDASLGTVMVGDDAGYVTSVAITAGVAAGKVVSPGSVEWSYATGGPVTATPLVFTTGVYFGSQDGKEYALLARTGALRWSVTTGGPITANNVTFGTSVAVGSGDGTIYYLSDLDGTVVNSLVGQTPIVGLCGSVNFVVATRSDGSAEASRTTGIDQTWALPSDGSAIVSSPVVNDGDVYLTGLDDNLRVFSVPGRPVY
jgi:outer membrane protein assembly factor BamB